MTHHEGKQLQCWVFVTFVGWEKRRRRGRVERRRKGSLSPSSSPGMGRCVDR